MRERNETEARNELIPIPQTCNYRVAANEAGRKSPSDADVESCDEQQQSDGTQSPSTEAMSFTSSSIASGSDE